MNVDECAISNPPPVCVPDSISTDDLEIESNGGVGRCDERSDDLLDINYKEQKMLAYGIHLLDHDVSPMRLGDLELRSSLAATGRLQGALTAVSLFRRHNDGSSLSSGQGKQVEGMTRKRSRCRLSWLSSL